MATSLTNPPKLSFLSQNPNWFGITTDIAAPRAGFVSISVTGSPGASDFITLNVEGDVLRFDFVTTPNNTGFELHRRPAGFTNAQYRDLLIDDFRANERISNDFEILANGVSSIRLIYKIVPGNVINVFDSAAGISAIFFASNYDPDKVNQFCKVHIYANDGTKPLVRLRAAYDTDRVAWINLAGIFQQPLGLPTEQSLRSIEQFTNYTVIQPEGVTEYYLWHADSYGNPPATERLQKEGPYHALPGGSSGVSRRVWGTGRYQLCHAYLVDRSNSQFYKPITSRQRDYMYFYSRNPVDGAAVTPWIYVVYSDGTTDELQVPTSAAQALDPATLYCFPSGPDQIGISQAPNWATKTAVRYEFQLRLDPTTVLTKIAYRFVTDCADWRIFYLIYENGAGGMETVAMRGKSTRRYGVSRSAFRLAQTRQQDLERGEIQYYDTEAFQEYELPTGWYPKAYVDHLRQLLVAERIWLIDDASFKFLAANVVTDSADLTTADDDLHALTIRIRLATPDINSHSL